MPGTVTEAAVAETRNMPGPDYWYSKKPVPDRAKEKIGKMVRGTAVGEVGFSGLRKELLKVDGGVFSAVFTENRKYLYRESVRPLQTRTTIRTAAVISRKTGLPAFRSPGRAGWSPFILIIMRGALRGRSGITLSGTPINWYA